MGLGRRSDRVGLMSASDRNRRLAVTVAEVFCVLGTLVGLGVLGGPEVQQAAGGALAADATYIAPAVPAFGIWTPIYLGLAAYTLWQWLPVTATPRYRQTGWLAAASMVLNALWLLVVRAGWLWVSVLVIIALALTLGVLLQRLGAHPPTSVLERVLTDVTFGLYLGWVSVATCANIAATLVDAGVAPDRPTAEIITIAVLAVTVALAYVYAVRLGPRLAVAAAMAWGLGWISYGRLTDRPGSVAVGVAAALAAAGVLAVTLAQRSASSRSARHA